MKALTLLPAHETLLKEEHVEAFKALAHETRMRVFVHLVRADREAPAGEIQETLGVPGPTLSHHLDLLRRAGLIQSRQEERYIYYSVKRETVQELVRLLTACC
ncbi:MAG: winged helix-turn-helix transcriptional regulator [Chloroflexi bacterium]|nr:winged helix-turn-helix transcriptional regulator [Chloroflexota bacterium]